MDDAQTLRSMVRDDAYRVVRVLADGPSGKTELVMLDGEGPLVRKHIPLALANPAAWAAAMETDEPLLPRIESLYRMPDELVVVYEYVPGEALDALVAREGRLEAAWAADIACDVCRAVSALHAKGVVHRDITPGNVIVAPDGAHLVDLGIARKGDKERRRDTTTLGTWGFAAPEQFGFAQTDARSDVYSLGRLMGYLLTGIHPSSEAFEEALDALEGEGERLAQVVRRATLFEPSARYQSAQELRSAIRQASGLEAHSETHMVAAGTRYVGDAGKEAARAPSASPVPQDGRRLSEVPLGVKAGAIALWTLLAVFVIIVAWTTLMAVTRHDPPWGASEYSLGFSTTLLAVLLAREAYRAVTLRGSYASSVHPALRWLVNSCIFIVVICIFAFLFAGMIGVATAP